MLLVLLVVSVVLNLGTSLLPRVPLIIPGLQALVISPNWGLLSSLVRWIASLMLFVALYRWVPNTQVTWRGAFLGALITSTAWQLVTEAFTWFLASGMASYEVVYGSLGGVVAVLFWVYLSNFVTVFGAHVAAGVDSTRPPPAAPGPVVAKDTATDEPTATNELRG